MFATKRLRAWRISLNSARFFKERHKRVDDT